MADPNRDTRDQVVEFRKHSPWASPAEMARELGVSRERIRQILVSEKMPTRRSAIYAELAASGKAPPITYAPGTPPQGYVRTGGVAIVATAKVAGLVGELLVAADLTARGYLVYTPISRHVEHFDMIAIRKNLEHRGPVTFEVRCGRRKEDGQLVFTRKQTSMADHFAIVVTGADVVYDPPLPD